MTGPRPRVASYSWARPGATALRAAGYVGVVRYLAPPGRATAGKVLTPAERDELHGFGLPIALVWESTAGRALYGSAGGRADAAAANAQADALGWPTWRPIFYAVDFAPTPAQMPLVVAYFREARRAPRAAWPYGGQPVIDVAGAGSAGWQASAASWSPHGPSPNACLIQLVGRRLPDVDDNLVVRPDWGGWLPPTARKDPPVKALLFAQGADVASVAAILGDALPVAATADPAEARAQAAAGTVVIAVGGPAVRALGWTWAQTGKVTRSGHTIACLGATRLDSLALAAQVAAGAPW